MYSSDGVTAGQRRSVQNAVLADDLLAREALEEDERGETRAVEDLY